jgi:hypothetical protein
MDVRRTLSLAIQYHQAGDLIRAEGCYHEVLRGDPANCLWKSGRPGGCEVQRRSHNPQGQGGMWLENRHDIRSTVDTRPN